MKWERGNKAILDHAKNGKSLLLFEGSDTKGEVIFLGEFINSGFIETELPDVGEHPKRLPVHLVTLPNR